jgi:hypothetical protein
MAIDAHRLRRHVTLDPRITPRETPHPSGAKMPMGG